jgi:hypothetical protein
MAAQHLRVFDKDEPTNKSGWLRVQCHAQHIGYIPSVVLKRLPHHAATIIMLPARQAPSPMPNFLIRAQMARRESV